MRIETAAIPLVPRSAAQCIDLAVMHAGRHLGQYMALWLAVAVPTCLLVHQVCTWYAGNVLYAAAIILLATSPLGVLSTLLTVPRVFGEPISLRQLWRQYGWRLVILFGKGLLLRLAIVVLLPLLVVPGVWLAVRKGFIVEEFCLTADQQNLHDEQTNQMLRHEGINLFGRGVAIALFCGLLTLTMFLLADYALDLLLGFPIFVGRIAEVATGFFRLDPGLSAYSVMVFTVTDPLVLALLTAAVLFTYPIGRLAWFFCYVDLRVRRDLWNVELQFIHLAQHLEAGT